MRALGCKGRASALCADPWRLRRAHDVPGRPRGVSSRWIGSPSRQSLHVAHRMLLRPGSAGRNRPPTRPRLRWSLERRGPRRRAALPSLESRRPGLPHRAAPGHLADAVIPPGSHAPPQRGQRSASARKTRRSSSAQGWWPHERVRVGHVLAASHALRRLGTAGTIAARIAAAGASTPWSFTLEDRAHAGGRAHARAGRRDRAAAAGLRRLVRVQHGNTAVPRRTWLGGLPVPVVPQLPEPWLAGRLRTDVRMPASRALGVPAGSYSPEFLVARPYAPLRAGRSSPRRARPWSGWACPAAAWRTCTAPRGSRGNSPAMARCWHEPSLGGNSFARTAATNGQRAATP